MATRRYDEREALNQGLWEKINQRLDSASAGIDRAMMGDEAYDHYQEISAEVRRLEHEEQLRLYRAAVAIGRRNRGEE